MTRDPIEFLATFLPNEDRCLTRTGVQIHNLQYWHDALEPWVGQHKKVAVHYDPRDITAVYVRAPSGVLAVAKVTTLGVTAISLAEWTARRNQERAMSRDPALVAIADASQKRRDSLVDVARQSRKVTRRQATAAAGDRYRTKSAPTTDEPPTNPASEQEDELDLPELGADRTYFDVEGCNDDD